MDPELSAFRDVVRGPEAGIDLARAALEIARIEHPGIEPAPWLERLDELAARSGVAPLFGASSGLARLREFLFEEEGFRGNAEHYFDPLNSCLDAVLDRRLGIPITLSLLMIEVGRRVGLRIEGVGLPGHFIVRALVGSDAVLVDPFHGGRLLSEDGATEVASQALGRPVTLTEPHFAAVGKAPFLARLLANLKGIYVQHEDWGKALEAIERLLLLEHASPVHLRDRGTVLMKLGDFHRGAADWERYLTRYPNARDGTRLRGQLKQIRQALASLN